MSDDDFEKEMEEIAAGGFPGADDEDMDDDFLKSFPGDDDNGPDFGDNEEDPFDAFPDEEDEDEELPQETSEETFAEDDKEDEDGLEWDDDDPETDPEELDQEEEYVEGLEYEEDEEEYEGDEEYEYEEEEGSSSGLDKGKLIFWGGTGAVAVALLGAGYAVLMPLFFGGSDAPVRQAPPVAQVQQFNPENTPRQPPQIPNVNGPRPTPPALPTASNDRIQVPGHPTNVDTNAIRPNLSGQDITLPGAPKLPVAGTFQPGMSENAAPTPTLPTKIVNAGNDDLLIDLSHNQPKPAPTPAPSGSDMGEVMGKLDSVLSRFDKFEKNFISKDDVEKMVGEAVTKATADLKVEGLDIDTTDLVRAADVKGINDSLSELVERVSAIEKGSDKSTAEVDPEIIEAKVAERVKEVEVSVAEQMLQMGKTLEAYEAALAELKSKVGTAPVKADDAKVAKDLKVKLEKQKRELVALKAKGGSFVPQRKPQVISGYRLAGLSKDQAWIETPSGVQRYSVGQDIRGIGEIEEFRAMDGNFAVITKGGIIIP
ncbi:hypothetical protein [Sulfitobacter sp. R18_1]|uniref:hypothetical protein n=1 Tax=Sulfitobacter sp. R18_1 TaxID=2821104 RepID=UPI001ADA13DB|nr:hypothetical protein [Sulfitobacter sp. R18_1]MBO9428521.1 hypothetical protein [Sulfitobacter sp. R18_1]